MSSAEGAQVFYNRTSAQWAGLTISHPLTTSEKQDRYPDHGQKPNIGFQVNPTPNFAVIDRPCLIASPPPPLESEHQFRYQWPDSKAVEALMYIRK